jgi:hypothetical protein
MDCYYPMSGPVSSEMADDRSLPPCPVKDRERRAFDSGLLRDFDEVVPVRYNYRYEHNSSTC